MSVALSVERVCAVVLAGGRGTRMGGVDKGLQPFRGTPMALHALDRLRRQTTGAPGLIAINANRNQMLYAQKDIPVWPDSLEGYPGPLAGFLTALEQCYLQKPAFDYVLTVPCDSPLFPLDLLERMASALVTANADIAIASAPQASDDGTVRIRTQPVFCLMRTHLLTDLQSFLAAGGRKIDAWTGQQRQVDVVFDALNDSRNAFFNANTLVQLQPLEQK